MANQEHLDILNKGVVVWNLWRQEHPETKPDLSGADLSGANLTGANLTEAILSQVNFLGAKLSNARLSYATLNNARLNEVDLSKAELIGANLFNAYLTNANLRGANLTRANLMYADLMGAKLNNACLNQTNLNDTFCRGADFTGATLLGADLSGAHLVHTNLTNVTLMYCRIYGISAWDVKLKGTKQLNLLITPNRIDVPTITVDNLKVAQFIYLLLNNQEIRDVIDTITSKVVLILGRFTDERKKVLDAIRDELRKRNYTPVLFDFEKPANRDLTETVSTLAHLARFIIVDLTDPSSAPHEVATIIPQCIVPVQPLLLQDNARPRHEYAMFHDLRTRYHWVLPTYQYKNITDLLASLKENVIVPAEQKAQELEKR